MIKLETLLKVLIANNRKEYIDKAMRIDLGIEQARNTKKAIVVNIYKSHLPEGKTFKGKDSWGNVLCPIVDYDMFKEKPYLVELPDGSTEWRDTENSNSKIHEIVEMIPQDKTLEV